MADATLPPELGEFIAEHIDSIAQLEALLLARSTPDAIWDVQTTAKRLYISEQEALETLAHLADHGILTREGSGYRYQPTPELAQSINVLADHYRQNLITITNLVHAKPRRIRQFADAFKLKKRD